MYNYIRSFLTNRTGVITVGTIESAPFTLGSKGTPQGSVLSPFLFNLSLIKIAPKSAEIPEHHHTFYADDITLWVTKRCDGYIEDTLQKAVDITEECAWEAGLICSELNSELLVIIHTPRGRRTLTNEHLCQWTIRQRGTNYENTRVVSTSQWKEQCYTH